MQKSLAQMIEWIKTLPIYGKFGRDVVWNVISFMILGISGIILNILIGRYYGPAILGVFNQTLAVYILLSQFAVAGLHFSTLKLVAEFSDSKQVLGSIIATAFFLTLVSASIICGLTFLIKDLVGKILESPGVSVGLSYIIPGLGFFALNKILFAAVNGLRCMRAYAFFSSLRYILLLMFLVICIIMKLSGEKITVIFSGTEFIILFCLLIYSRRIVQIPPERGFLYWTKKHISFAFRAAGGGVLSGVNTRVDVLMLGYFLSDKIVGIYSLAAVLAEGISELGTIVRTNINPVLAKHYADKKLAELKSIVGRGIRIFYPVMAFVYLCAIICYPMCIKLFMRNSVFMESWAIFCVLAIGKMLSIGYRPFNMFLLQTGHPKEYTIFLTLTILTNILLNLLLIPLLGMYGAAIATGFSFVLSVVFLKILVKNTVGINI